MKTAKPKPLKIQGQHGPQRAPRRENSAIRLYRLMHLTTDTPLASLLRQAGDEIVRLRRAETAEPGDEPQSRR